MSNFEKKLTADGKPNPRYIDLLDEDPVIPSQKYICMSFISPENIIKQREHFMFEKFIRQWDFTKSIEKFCDFLNFMAFKYNLKLEDVLNSFKEYADEERAKLREYTVTDDFKNFMDKNEDKLLEEFNKEHNFQTSIRGFKFRGAFSSLEEAKMHSQKLRDNDGNHNVLVGTGFVWTPLDPDIYKTGGVEFAEDELNQLHHAKKQNEEKAKQEFDAYVKDKKRQAIEENIRKARETGAVLTQTITEDGELVGVNSRVNFEDREVATDPNKGLSDNDDLNRVD
jgi:hypothetical protein